VHTKARVQLSHNGALVRNDCGSKLPRKTIEDAGACSRDDQQERRVMRELYSRLGVHGAVVLISRIAKSDGGQHLWVHVCAHGASTASPDEY
jgi:hypothetical protein